MTLEQQVSAVNRIINRLRRPITEADTASIPATARDEVEAILAGHGPLALHEIIAWNHGDTEHGLGHVWSAEALEEGLGALLTTGAVTAMGFTFHEGAAVGIFTLTEGGK